MQIAAAYLSYGIRAGGPESGRHPGYGRGEMNKALKGLNQRGWLAHDRPKGYSLTHPDLPNHTIRLKNNADGGITWASLGRFVSDFEPSNGLYVYSTSNPATALTSPGVEASARTFGFQATGKSYISVQNIETKYHNQAIRLRGVWILARVAARKACPVSKTCPVSNLRSMCHTSASLLHECFGQVPR
jgi:hypothetical protein